MTYELFASTPSPLVDLTLVAFASSIRPETATYRIGGRSSRQFGLQGEPASNLPCQPILSREPASKRRKLRAYRPTRASARIANASLKPGYVEGDNPSSTRRVSSRSKSPQQPMAEASSSMVETPFLSPSPELQSHEYSGS
ncbi:hypothetical protein F4823DRAFT_579363 [Ustulina deusta]|nr:hypothetical protein F4823DRAFT_579363 [Ustulina deusta]